ncbi:MAG: FGGY-family carbohydrate kinase [Pseudomonadota bacterium]
MAYVLGIDVGSGSARCGVFNAEADLLGVGKHPIARHCPQTGFVEQSSDDIWQAICLSVADAMAAAGAQSADVRALSYSATCSLVLLDRGRQPLALSETERPWNIVMWMDHRAQAETEECNATGADVLKNLGGALSVEMQIPKLIWVKRNRPDLWARLGYAGDLADFLCHRSTGTLERSICTLGCKWTYDEDTGGWDDAFLAEVGLDDLLSRAALPRHARPVGAPVGTLTPKAAAELGLSTQCKVGMGLIDAHAGALGTSALARTGLDSRLALIAGTSNCHIALTSKRVEVPGVWGPYADAVLDGWYALEGGQSATGAVLDQILSIFACPEPDPHRVLGQQVIDGLRADPDFGADLCVLPDFLGNRSPFADPNRRGAILGMTLEDPATLLPRVYGAAALGIAFGTRQIIEAMRRHGLPIDTIDLSGGHAKSELLVRLYADATGCDLVIPACEEPVLLGAAVSAALANGTADAFRAAARRRKGVRRRPDPRNAANFDLRYRRFAAHYPGIGTRDDALAAAE